MSVECRMWNMEWPSLWKMDQPLENSLYLGNVERLSLWKAEHPISLDRVTAGLCRIWTSFFPVPCEKTCFGEYSAQRTADEIRNSFLDCRHTCCSEDVQIYRVLLQVQRNVCSLPKYKVTGPARLRKLIGHLSPLSSKQTVQLK